MTKYDSLLEMLDTDMPVFTVYSIKSSITPLLKNSSQSVEQIVTEQLENYKTELLEAINFPLLSSITKELKKAIVTLHTEEIKITSNLQADHASELISIIHINLAELQRYREEINHYNTLCSQAKTTCKNFVKVSEEILKQFLKGSVKSAKESLLLDIEVYTNLLTQNIKDLQGLIEEVITPRVNLQLRKESSLRLLEKYQSNSGMGREFSIER